MSFRAISVNSSSYWENRFEAYRSFILEKYKGLRNIENYSLRRLRLEDLLDLFLIFDSEKDSIAGFVSVFRPKFWPLGIARISNRTWVDPKYRAKGLSLKDPCRDLRAGKSFGVTVAFEPQIQCCLKNGIDLAVITRENKARSSKNNLEFLYGLLKKTEPDWLLAESYYLTCLNEDSPDCWQRLIYFELKKGGGRLLRQIPSLGVKEYEARFL